MVAEAEGVVKFDLQFRKARLEDSVALAKLVRWRDVFYRLGAIGQDPGRYDNLGFGNISHRLSNSDRFLISGTQTAQYPAAHREHFTCVDRCDPETNRVSAHGPVRPSSESLAHGAIYALSPEIQCVVHGHMPHLWRHRVALGLPSTAAGIAYGTPQMARAITELYLANGKPDCAVFGMSGHEDGIIGFASEFSEIETLLREYSERLD